MLWTRGLVFEYSRSNSEQPKGNGMEIHLCKPGGEREGPYTLDQINEALAAGQYRGSDYWAWHSGLTEWVPLYSVPGVQERAEAAAGYDTQHLDATAMKAADNEPAEPAAASTEVPDEALASEGAPGTDKVPLNSGMPFSALEHIFILTTGEAREASRSSQTATTLEQVIGTDWETIRQVVPRDAISQCAQLEGLTKEAVPALIWRTLTAFKPDLLAQAKEGLHRICVRRFRIETGDLVAVFLFYNKSKLQ
jgi:hypothetical protein